MRKLFCLIILIVLLSAISGCGIEPENGSGDINLEVLKSAPLKISLSNQDLYLESYLWRDFMPISPPDGKAMIALIKVMTIDSTDIPAGIELKQIWVSQGINIWNVEFKENREGEAYELIRLVRDGPKWEPGSKVDVVVEIIHKNKKFYLKEENVVIARTD